MPEPSATADDPDRTRLGPAPAGPPPPGELADDEFGNALPAGTRLEEFELLSVIGEGGFGIVYLAQDHSLHRRVAIKEYMPSSLAARTQAMTVSVRSRRHAETFEAGLRSFINEARLLASFDHPSLIKVHRFWEGNGTAYMVMPCYVGRTLGEVLKALPGPPDELWLRALLVPLLDALETMHRADTCHRDIAPDNIMILEDGRPVILDLGAARRVIGDMTQALTVILKTGYAPIEQYGDMPGVKQGPWTDLYALASVVHFALTGRTPPQSVTRVVTDKYQPLVRSAAGLCGPAFLEAIDACLAVLPQHRPQSVAELRALLAAPAVGPAPSAAPPAAPVRSPPPPPQPPPPPLRATPPAGSPPAALPRPAAARSSGLWMAAAAVLLVGAAGLAYRLGRPAHAPTPAAEPAPVTTASAPEPQPAPAAPPPPVATAPAAPAASLPGSAASAQADPVTVSPASAPAVARTPERKTPPPSPPAPPRSAGNTPAPARKAPSDESPTLSPPEVSDRSVWSPDGRPPKVIRAQPPAPDYVTQLKCNDLLQKSALGDPVTDAERSFMRRECR
ncbi:serine/threonine protein kinase [Sphaerotilus uruguayifluvii]|uniref:Protein kinase domain-containing protein n=1 Tax=Sphaerotilus uruguayifluvii TaxID=2735897 RepID=A0ABX2G2Y2_9BURK|nr:serine/threonine-protein kinase [Leptothrix sp. C29]NRT56653.1 hypothetical protein [Leptothrix sp. C29]